MAECDELAIFENKYGCIDLSVYLTTLSLNEAFMITAHGSVRCYCTALETLYASLNVYYPVSVRCNCAVFFMFV